MIQSSWRPEGNVILGTVEWARCNIEREWTTTETGVTKRPPRRWIGITELVGGAGLVALAAPHAHKTKKDCGRPGLEADINELYGDCIEYKEPQPLAGLATFAGIGILVTGIFTLIFQRTSTETEVLRTIPEHIRSTENCITRSDLKELSLVLRFGRRRYLPVRLDAKGNARIEISEELPVGVALPIVVYRVPRGAEGLLKRGQVIGSVKLEEHTYPQQ